MMLKRAELSARWSVLHNGIDPASVPFLSRWLSAMWTLARPLAWLRVGPLAVTLAGVGFAVVAWFAAVDLPAVALFLVGLSVLCDGLDGAVAVVSNHHTVSGAIADRTADRFCDAVFAAIVWRLGAPWWLALAAAVLSHAMEYVRVRRASHVRLTVNERPSRLICTALALGAATVSGATWPATVCAAVWTVLAVVALAQISAGVRGPSR